MRIPAFVAVADSEQVMLKSMFPLMVTPAESGGLKKSG